MKIAAISDDETTISQHFGRAPLYVVVTVEAGKIVSKETRAKTGHHTFAAQESPHLDAGERHGSVTRRARLAQVRQQARQLAEKDGFDCIISDGPPGIGCPVISSLSGASLALLVTEPTLSGIHDLERVLGVCQHFSVPALVCINKYDINEDNTHQIEGYCLSQGVEVAARIPFDNIVTEAMVHGLPVVEYSRNGVSHQIESLWEIVSKLLNK